MKRAVIVLLAVIAGADMAPAQKSYKELTFPPLKEIKVPEVERHVLPNGMILYLLEDHTLPLVRAHALVRTGSRWEPADKAGLAAITGQVLRTGGTTSKTGDQLDEELERIAASVESSIGLTSGSVSMSALKEDADRVLAIFAEVLMNPAFREDKLELAKIQARTAIARRNDDVLDIASREFRKLLYGKDSPYARTPEYETINNIKREDLVAFHKRYFHPNNVILGVWGDFDPKHMRAKIEELFGNWPKARIDLPPLPEVKTDLKGSVNYIRKEDINQSNIRMGHLDGRLDDPDYYALDVMATILGGGFSSRLFRNVRSAMGLAYAVGADWDAEYDHPGRFYVYCNTKLESTFQAIQAIIKEIEDVARKEVSDEELRVAKESTLNSFVFNFDTRGEIIRRLMTYEYYGYPKDYLQKYYQNIERVTKQDVLAAAKRNLRPQDLVILVVGREDKFDRPLADLGRGKVNTIDITIPEPKAKPEALPEARPEALAKGRDLLAKAVRASGGSERIRAVRDLTQEYQMKLMLPQGEMDISGKTVFALPNRLRLELKLPMGQIVRVYDGANAWLKTPQGVQDLPEAQRAEMLKEIFRSTLSLLYRFDDPERTVQHLETTNLDGKQVDVILISDRSGNAVRLFVEGSSGLILKKAYRGRSQMGAEADFEEILEDFRPVDGLTLPFKVTISQDGKKFAEITLTDVKINSGAPPELFSK